MEYLCTVERKKLVLEAGRWEPSGDIAARWKSAQVIAERAFEGGSICDAAAELLASLRSHNDFRMIAEAVISAVASYAEATARVYG